MAINSRSSGRVPTFDEILARDTLPAWLDE